MKTKIFGSVLVLAAFTLLVAGAALAADEEAALIGLKKCSMCHKKDKSGNQLAVWEASAHAKAYESLASEEAKAEAAKLGIEDPQAAPECLKCHVTAFPVMDDLENQKITLEEGVSCESCHGAGGNYYKKKTMEAIFAGETDGASVGLVTPDEATCTQCHTPEGNPFHKEFDFAKYAEKIAHPYPEGYPPAEEGTK